MTLFPTYRRCEAWNKTIHAPCENYADYYIRFRKDTDLLIDKGPMLVSDLNVCKGHYAGIYKKHRDNIAYRYKND